MTSAVASKDNKVSSLDLLEDCLAMVHMSRTNTLRNRAKEYQFKMAKRRKHAALNSRQRVVVERTEDELDEQVFEQEREHESLMDAFAHQFDNSQQQKKESSPSKRSPGGGHGVGVEGGSPLFKTTNKFVPTTDQNSMADTKASSLLLEFKVELLQWVDKNRVKMEDDTLRGEVADYFTDKYMSRQLDTLQSSRTVTKIRKEVAAAIETFATDGIVEATIVEQKEALLELAKDTGLMGAAAFAPPATKISTTTATAPTAVSTTSSGAAAATVVAGSKKSVAFADSAPAPAAMPQPSKAREQQTAERDKIKQKYEEMKAASKAAESNKVNEMEDNIDSIKALLSSLNKPKS